MHGTIEPAYEVETRPFAELASIAPQWRTLAERALSPNVFYEPAFALAAQPALAPEAGADLVWSRGATARLVGLFPTRIERHRYGLPWPLPVGWIHPYAPLGVPLVDRDVAEAAIAAWLDYRARRKLRIALLPMFPQSGPLAAALAAALARRGGASIAFAPHERALLAPIGDRADYIERSLPRKKLKELGRVLRRLGEEGVVATDVSRDPAAIASALADFLSLEAAGWKGRAGTAARQAPAIRAFMESAARSLAREGKAEIVRLLLDGRAIAAVIVLRSRDTAWCWKIAYDESHARASPGVQLILHVTRALLADPGIACADSCATPDHPMIDHIWRERLALADRLVRVGPHGGAAFALTRALETARRRSIAAAKTTRDRLGR